MVWLKTGDRRASYIRVAWLIGGNLGNKGLIFICKNLSVSYCSGYSLNGSYLMDAMSFLAANLEEFVLPLTFKYIYRNCTANRWKFNEQDLNFYLQKFYCVISFWMPLKTGSYFVREV